MDNITLSNGVKMPLEGFGVFQVTDPKECEEAVYNAINVGYRLIDTAALYMNEGAVGSAIARAIKDGLATREELFITTKLWCNAASYEGAKAAFSASMDRLGLDYLDLYLIHQPYGDIYGAWRAMEELLAEGKVRAIGVANFYPGKFTEFAEIVDVKPMVDQIELHPFYAQPDAIENMRAYGCQPQAWGPLAEGRHGIFTHPVLSEIGAKYGKTPAQVALKWNAQRGVSIIPKSVHVDRMKQNIDIWDFELTADDVAAIDVLDLGHSEIIDHNDPNVVKYILGTNVDD